MEYKGFELISAGELTDLEILKSKVLYSDTIEELSFVRQKEIYDYCKLHATFKACIENLKQLRYAVTRIYFLMERGQKHEPQTHHPRTGEGIHPEIRPQHHNKHVPLPEQPGRNRRHAERSQRLDI